jgi:hypothetical protein
MRVSPRSDEDLARAALPRRGLRRTVCAVSSRKAVRSGDVLIFRSPTSAAAAQIMTTDMLAKNGVIHVIDRA